jgi:hypothetical protein
MAAHLSRGHDGYWLGIPAEALARQARMARDAEAAVLFSRVAGRRLPVDR